MRILAIDSSGMTASAALATEDRLEAVYSVNYHKTHSQTLVPMLEEIRKMTELDLKTVDAIAVAGGPGSFTGLRIGSATAKGLGLALQKPLIHVPTLEGLAWNVWGTDSLICPMMDARRDQVYTAVYQFRYASAEKSAAAGSCLETVQEQEVVPVKEIINRLNELGREVIVLGDGAVTYREEILAECRVPVRFAPVHLMEQSAASVAACAFGYLAKGMTETAAAHRPDYLRVSQAERERALRKDKTRQNLICRQMTQEDADKVAAIEKETFSDPWSRESFLSSLSSPDTLYLVAEDGQSHRIVGYAGLLRSFENADITNVAVLSSCRRCGIGSMLLRSLLDRADEEGVENYALEVRESNTAAIALYEKMGFQKEGVRKDYYSRPRENAVLMWKRKQKGTVTDE